MMASRIFNFSAGPGVMPQAVLELAQREFVDWSGSGISMLEMPFTSDEFKSIMQRAQRNLSVLMSVPDNYHVLFMHGGATAQFSLVPLNLLGNAKCADYLETGYWSQKAILEGRRYSTLNIAGSSQGDNFERLPSQDEISIDPSAAYCHYTSNETANGIQFHEIPDTGGVPLVADMTSDFLSRPMDISRYGLIYASSQKNIGPAGFTVVIVRDDLLERAHPATPQVFDYRLQSRTNSLINTPTTFAIYLADLVFQWVNAMGGLSMMEENNIRRSRQLYETIDDSNGFFLCPVRHPHRSRVNICFTLADKSLTPLFLSEAARQGMVNLKGHSVTGGIRASLYNAMPDEGVAKLTTFMRQFIEGYSAHV
ncbi:MAG: 3-phosphoserine/phosphohydroxythreonine transaminase [Nitrosomonadales bacterium]|nr:3-phosphoserine/phosphohydroxythreonine transaminase [Nitrosomonadales bacterium]